MYQYTISYINFEEVCLFPALNVALYGPGSWSYLILSVKLKI